MSYPRESMQELVGRKIQSIEVSEGEQYLRVTTDSGVLTYIVVGDCCSESWFAEILGVKVLLDGVVASVEEVALPEPQDEYTRQEYDAAYGYKITTDKGYADVVFRNSSNGYYGGELELVKHYNVPDVSLVFKSITEDWTAWGTG